MILRCRLLLLIFFLLSSFAPTISQATEGQTAKSKLRVVTTIRPLHSLLSNLMQGVATPVLLLDSSQSVHHYSLRPSQRSTLSHSDILFWVGENLESFMPRVLNAIPKKVQVVELLNTKGLKLLEPRSNTQHHHSSFDPHIWLSIDNAISIARKMSASLIRFDPEHQLLYQSNLLQLTNKLLEQKKSISAKFIKPEFNYLVYHDALQYFEEQINIAPIATISTDEEQTPGIRHISKINKIIKNNTINCLIYNTPTLPAIARNLIDNKKILTVHIDPLGQNLKADPDLYFNLLDSITNGYVQCQAQSEKH